MPGNNGGNNVIRGRFPESNTERLKPMYGEALVRSVLGNLSPQSLYLLSNSLPPGHNRDYVNSAQSHKIALSAIDSGLNLSSDFTREGLQKDIGIGVSELLTAIYIAVPRLISTLIPDRKTAFASPIQEVGRIASRLIRLRATTPEDLKQMFAETVEKLLAAQAAIATLPEGSIAQIGNPKIKDSRKALEKITEDLLAIVRDVKVKE